MIKQQWQSWNEREQLAVAGATLLVVAYLSYALIFGPLLNAVAHTHQQLLQKKNTLIWMQHAQQNYRPTQQAQKVTVDNLLSLLTQLLKEASFHRFAYQLAQSDNGEIQLSFNEVPYNAVMLWLREQTSHYVLTIKNLNVTKTNTPGVVTITVTFGVG